MDRYSFADDYSEGCHPTILEILGQTNLIQQTAYGDDAYSNEAKELIRSKLGRADAAIYFVAGGTHANLIVISSILKSHEAVIAAEIGHILQRETGAVEATGHKILAVPSNNGKLSTGDIQEVLDKHAHAPHMVKPRVVYISNATEIGTIYSKQELERLCEFCQEKELYLFLDGARLGSALCSEKNDLTLPDLTKLTDLFYIGGTKNGALIGEAIVINNPALKADFPFHIKQRGAMLSKGRLLGIQFLALFREDLYFELATRANSLAKKISQALEEKGYALSAATETNQIFAILPDALIEKLNKKFGFFVWERKDDKHSVVRLVTSWATDEQKVDEFIDSL